MEMDFSPCEDKSPKVRFLEIFFLRYELEYFYEEQLQRMEQLGIETLPFDDCLCQVLPSLSFLCYQSHIILSPQMLDMIRPLNKHAITLKDLKQCKMTPVFFDTFFNLEKYLDHEQRDPFATQRETDEDGNEVKILRSCILRSCCGDRFVTFPLLRCRTGIDSPPRNTSSSLQRRVPPSPWMTCESLKDRAFKLGFYLDLVQIQRPT